MIDLPNNILRKQLNSNLKRGSVLRTEIYFGSEPLFKRLILLNNDFSLNEIFYILSTSEVQWYKKNCDAEPLKGNYIYVYKGQTCLNPDEDIVINCRRVDSISKDKLLENYKNEKLEFLESFPDDILTEIDEILARSTLIPPKIKRKIL